MWLSSFFLTIELILVAVLIAGTGGIVSAWAVSVLGRADGAGRARRRRGGNGPVLPAQSRDRTAADARDHTPGAAPPAGWDRHLIQLYAAAMLVAIAMPMILHAAAWEATAGKFGWATLTQTGSRSFGNFSGLVATGWIHGLVGLPLVALATWYGTAAVPPSVVEQSRLDMGPTRAWWTIRLPIAIPWVTVSILAVAVLATTEMTAADLYGYRTIADQFYLFYAAAPTALSVVAVLALPAAVGAALLACVWLARCRAEPLTATHPLRRDVPCDWEQEQRWAWPARIVVAGTASLVALVPVVSLIVKAGHEVQVTATGLAVGWSALLCWENLASAPTTYADEYAWTALIAVLTAASAVVIAWPLAALSRLSRRRVHWIDFVSIIAILLPGPLVGLLIVTVFQLNFPGARTLYQQTLVPTVIALLFRAGPVAYWIIRTGYDGIGEAIFDAARLDTNLWRRWLWIDRPLMGRRLTIAALAAGVVSAGDVPAMLPVLPPGVQTVGTRLFGLLHSGARYQEASLAFWYVATIVVIALVVRPIISSSSRF